MFSYDDVFDQDVHNFLKSLPSKKQSSCIRQALRLYMQFQATGQPVTQFHGIPTFGIHQQNNIEEPKTEEQDIFTEELDDDILNGFEMLSEEDLEESEEE